MRRHATATPVAANSTAVNTWRGVGVNVREISQQMPAVIRPASATSGHRIRVMS
jgi:hypothetical protein